MNPEVPGQGEIEKTGQGNHAKEVFKDSHPKPICPKCNKKANVFYIRGVNREYIPSGYYCPRCDIIVKPMNINPPVVYRMDIRDFLNETNEKFDLILADPPWTYNIEAKRESDRISSHYHQMTTEEICDLPVQRITAQNCILLLWATPPKLDDGLTVLKSWGFEYDTNGVWNKELMGLGIRFRQQHEHLLVGIKGHVKQSLNYRSVINEKRTDHSRKPVKSYEIIEGMFPEAKKIELFSRWVYPGWTGVGDQAEPKPEQEMHAKNKKKCMQNFEVI
jgi:N6-adenosine-specific RNA methylase IME4